MARHLHARGLTLIEAMLLVVIMSIVAIGAGIGLQAVAKVPTATDDIMAVNARIVDTLETWRGKPWASMVTPTPNPDTVTINGKSYDRTITVEDADPAATNDPDTFDPAKVQPDFRRITVQIGSRRMRVYVAQP
jgi:hypothetical protein